MHLNAKAYVAAAGAIGEVRYNEFGADGGWVVPFTKKKVFFFVDYQGLRQIPHPFIQAFCPRRQSVEETSARI